MTSSLSPKMKRVGDFNWYRSSPSRMIPVLKDQSYSQYRHQRGSVCSTVYVHGSGHHFVTGHTTVKYSFIVAVMSYRTFFLQLAKTFHYCAINTGAPVLNCRILFRIFHICNKNLP